MLMAVAGMKAIGPVVRTFTNAAGDGVDWLIAHDIMPIASVLIEPAKVLFLNNAINHGVLSPLGVTQAAEAGKSIMFMLETNPGPGLGVLLAYLFFGPRRLRPTAPAAIIIHFFGGIHEIYFPYILMKPRMILATIAGGATGIAIFLATGAGLVAPPAPGSIFAYIAQTPKGSWFGVYAGVLASAAVSFAVGSALLGFGKLAEERTVGEADGDGDGAEAASDEAADDRPARTAETSTDAEAQAQAASGTRAEATTATAEPASPASSQPQSVSPKE
jgi:PTS system mannitol-specific IIC component